MYIVVFCDCTRIYYSSRTHMVSRPETLLHLDSFVSDDEIIKLAWYVHASGVGTRV